MMSKYKEKIEELRKSTFFVNKLYLIVLFIVLIITDGTLALCSFLSYIIIYLWNILTAKLPIDNNGRFKCVTKVYRIVEDHELKVDIWYPNQE
ncbi:MAG TPA: hypothetical protein GXX37_10220, partial [Clostridiaceae bacterium]|nr:hypothetical protein [Clostridiaceae bacterium]